MREVQNPLSPRNKGNLRVAFDRIGRDEMRAPGFVTCAYQSKASRMLYYLSPGQIWFWFDWALKSHNQTKYLYILRENGASCRCTFSFAPCWGGRRD